MAAAEEVSNISGKCSLFIKKKTKKQMNSTSLGCGRCSQFDMEEEIKSNQQSWKRFPLQMYHTDLIISSQGPKCVISTLERRHCGLRGPAWFGEAPVEGEVGHHPPSKAAAALQTQRRNTELLQFISMCFWENDNHPVVEPEADLLLGKGGRLLGCPPTLNTEYLT